MFKMGAVKLFNKNNEERIDIEATDKSFKSNSRIKKMLGLGSIGLTLIAAAAIIGPNPSISNLLTKVEADSSHKICVSGYYESDPSINAQKGDCGESTFVPPVNTGENSEPSGDFEKGIFTTSDSTKFVCGPHSYTISKENYEKGVENFNKANAGDTSGISEVTDGWSILYEEGGSAMFANISFSTVNTAGPNMFLFDDASGTCTVSYVSNEVNITDKGVNTAGIAQESFNSEGVQIGYSYVNAEGKAHREGAAASANLTNDGKGVLSEEWRINGEFHRTDGPAYIYSSTGSTDDRIVSFYINGSQITDRETWISSGGTPEGWDDYQ